MTEQRLSARDLRLLVVWVLLGVMGAGVAYKYFFRAFPEASLDFKVSRSEALETARKFVTAQGQKLEGYQSSIVFDVDDTAKTYLERTAGLEKANRLMASEISVWYWKVRFFRPGQKEEFDAKVNPAGRVVGYLHEVEEAAPGAHLDREAALAAAEKFLTERYGANLNTYEFLPEEANPVERPNRRDWNFTWQLRGFRVPEGPEGAPYRLRVGLVGDQVGAAEPFLKVPEAWQRDYQRLRSSNNLLEMIAILPYVLLYGAMLYVIYDLGRRGLIRWGGALKLGLVLAMLFFLMNVNAWPIVRSGYDTNASYSGFFLGQMAGAALLSLVLGLIVSLTVVAAEPLYREYLPDKLRLGAAFTLPGIRSREFFRSCVIGLGFAAAHIGYVVVFYIVGKKFGVWAPQDVSYTNVVSTTAPWIYPLTIGLYAAASEEFLFRLFAIPFLLRTTKSKFLAVVLPAFAWSFLHSNYPQEPAYTRGIEIGLIGIVAGLVMLRWGILATLVWHYTVDAVLVGLFLLRSGSLYFRVSGAIVGAAVLIPLAVAGVLYLSKRGFAEDEALLNRAEPLVEKPGEITPPEETAPRRKSLYEALGGRAALLLVTGAVLGTVLMVAVRSKTVGSYVRFSVDAQEAEAKADAVLRQQGVSPEKWKRAATVVATYNPYASEYLRREVGIAGVNRIYEEQVPSVFWRVRYFRDSQTEEYAVVIRTDGELHAVHHTLEEQAKGASLTKEEALARAETYLREEKKLDLTRWKLMSSDSKKQPNRTDHVFTWEELKPVGKPPAGASEADEAHVRIELKVQGDEVSGYRIFVKIPEEWERAQSKETLVSKIHTIGAWVFIASLLILILVLFFKNLRQPSVAGIPWRRLALWALWGAAGFLILFANSFPTLLAGYPTQVSFKTFVASAGIGFLISVAFIYGLIFFVLGLGWFLLAPVFGEERMPGWSGMPAHYYRDALGISVAGTAILLGLTRLPYLLDRIWPTVKHSLGAQIGEGLWSAPFPGAQLMGTAVYVGLFVVASIAVAAGFLAGYARKGWLRFLLVALAVVLAVGDWGSPADFTKRLLLNLVVAGVVWWGVRYVVRFNLLAYFLLAANMVLLGSGIALLRQPNPFFRANGYAVVLALAALLAWPLIAWRRASASPASGPPT